ncbi:unnamed protein product [Sphenostylis stenocarpa]|uniref:Uncharacterized protein n=1 Tax=Sphenostylis stenocarpa TaxID=92480 RepID=A0AA86W4Z4_9FABA|nr:unnamed protein product [Sphenostylis stenocarpa]
MTLVKIVFAAVLLALTAFTGDGFSSIPRMTALKKCNSHNHCKWILPGCKGSVICNDGYCTCDETKEGDLMPCKRNRECRLHCQCKWAYCYRTAHVCVCPCNSLNQGV